MIETGVGIANPLWFIGVVENNMDQRLEGRVQVRAFGIHGTVDQIPSADLPWAILCIGNHDVNFTVPPLNAWVFGVMLDGRDAQQPMIMGLIPTQMTGPVDPTVTGWGVALGPEQNRMSQGSRPQDAGQPSLSRLQRGENLHETYILPQETNRVREIAIAGGSANNLVSVGNLGVVSGDERNSTPAKDSAAGAEPVGNIPGSPTNTVPKSARSDYIKAGLMTRGLTGPEADAWVMNFYDESKLNPGVEETVANVYGTKGFGLAQWTGDRRDNLAAFARSQGKPINDTDMQLDFLMTELNGPESKNWEQARRGGSAGQIAAGIVDKILRPNARSEQQRMAAYLGGQGYSGSSAVNNENYNSTASGGYNSSSAAAPTAVSWEEPAPAYHAQYPYNRVVETASGHSVEIDDTPGSERIMIWHKSGSYIQLSTTTHTHKAVGDKYEINDRNHHVYVGGTNVITVEGDSHILTKGNKIEEINGDYKVIVRGNYEMTGGGQINIIGAEDAQIRAARVSMESNVENTNMSVGKVLRFESTETMHFKTKNMFFESTEAMTIKAGTTFALHGTGKISLASDAEAYLSGTALHIKGEDEIRVGASVVHIQGDTVNIDDIVNMANGESEAPEESELEVTPAESATPITRPAPPSRSLPSSVLV